MLFAHVNACSYLPAYEISVLLRANLLERLYTIGGKFLHVCAHYSGRSGFQDFRGVLQRETVFVERNGGKLVGCNCLSV